MLVAARVAIDAKIGPLHGVQTIPSARPVINPPEKSLRWFLPTPPKRPASEEIRASNLRESAGTTIEKPRTRRTTTATLRRKLGDSPMELSSSEIERVSTAKEIATPTVIPSGRRFDLDWVTSASTIGSSGHMQGAKMVNNPEIKATP